MPATTELSRRAAGALMYPPLRQLGPRARAALARRIEDAETFENLSDGDRFGIELAEATAAEAPGGDSVTRRFGREDRVVTVHQPWAWAIIHAGKNVENRNQHTHHRGILWIHAGKKVDPDGAAFVRALGVMPPETFVHGAILGSVTVVGSVRDFPSDWSEPGYVHWVLAGPRPLSNPVRLRGQQGMFRLPPELLDAS